MTVWLDAARVAAGVNVLLLLALGWVWIDSYRQHGARHTLGLLVMGGFLLVENLLWLYFYIFHEGYIDWFIVTGTEVQAGMLGLCGLELVALAALVRITWL